MSEYHNPKDEHREVEKPVFRRYRDEKTGQLKTVVVGSEFSMVSTKKEIKDILEPYLKRYQVARYEDLPVFARARVNAQLNTLSREHALASAKATEEFISKELPKKKAEKLAKKYEKRSQLTPEQLEENRKRIAIMRARDYGVPKAGTREYRE